MRNSRPISSPFFKDEYRKAGRGKSRIGCEQEEVFLQVRLYFLSTPLSLTGQGGERVITYLANE